MAELPTVGSGQKFSPYPLPKEAVYEKTILTPLNLDPLVQTACRLEDVRFVQGSNTLDLSSRPPSPLTELESSDEELDEDESTQAPGSVERKRKQAGAKARRSQKRAKKAMSGHAPETYTVKASLAEKLADSEPIKLSIDTLTLPASSVGAWIGDTRTQGRGKIPTLQTLKDEGFTVLEWDG